MKYANLTAEERKIFTDWWKSIMPVPRELSDREIDQIDFISGFQMGACDSYVRDNNMPEIFWKGYSMGQTALKSALEVFKEYSRS